MDYTRIKQANQQKNISFHGYTTEALSIAEFTTFWNILNSVLGNVRTLHYHHQISTNSNSKELWRTLNELTEQTKVCLPACTVEDGRMLTNTEAARSFNSYNFTSVVDTLVATLPQTNESCTSDVSSAASCFLYPTTSQELVKLAGTSAKKRTHIHDMQLFIFLRVFHIIVPVLTLIYNKCLREGSWCSQKSASSTDT